MGNKPAKTKKEDGNVSETKPILDETTTGDNKNKAQSQPNDTGAGVTASTSTTGGPQQGNKQGQQAPRPLLPPHIEVPFDKYVYPFENIVFEGGGNKGLAYCGAVRVLEEAGIWKQIRRVAGTSSGAMTAALLSVGYNSYDLENFLSHNLKKVFVDHKCGYCSLMPNMTNSYGWNPGKSILDWFGSKLKEKTGNADITFMEVYQKFGKELCVIVTNVNQMTTEYCHAKTTPDLPVRVVVRMSMAIPGLFTAVKYSHNKQTDWYVDGGVLCNYPIHCFDGWWLSLKPEDSYVHRLHTASQLPKLYEKGERFGGHNYKTLGFLLYSENEPEVLQTLLEERDGKQISDSDPQTKLAKKRLALIEGRKEAEQKHDDTLQAANKFLQMLRENGFGSGQTLGKNDLEQAIKRDGVFNENDFHTLFGDKITVEEAFKQLQPDKKKTEENVTYEQIQSFLERKTGTLQDYFLGYRRRDVKKLSTFTRSLQDTIMNNTSRFQVQKDDLQRTVGINTYYLGTMDFKMEPGDKALLVEQGRRSTKAFLFNYTTENVLPWKDV